MVIPVRQKTCRATRGLWLSHCRIEIGPVVVSRHQHANQAMSGHGDGTLAAMLPCSHGTRRSKNRGQRLSHLWAAARSSSAWLLASCRDCLIWRCSMCTFSACVASASDSRAFHWPCTSPSCSAAASRASSNLHGQLLQVVRQTKTEACSLDRQYCHGIGSHSSLALCEVYRRAMWPACAQPSGLMT